MEKIRDLLCPVNDNLKIRDAPNRGVYIESMISRSLRLCLRSAFASWQLTVTAVLCCAVLCCAALWRRQMWWSVM
jgi:hypothetical protein